MHTTPWFHATNIKNAPATNLVQIGIGLQMLGRRLHERQGLEGTPGSAPALGLLDFDTTLASEKTRWRHRNAGAAR